MAPFLVPILSMLADKGLNLLSGAVEGGAEKAVEFVKDKTGIDISTKEELSPAEVAELKKFEDENKLELGKLALLNKQEDNRHDEFEISKEVEDRKDARTMFEHGSTFQTKVGEEVMKQSKFLIPALITLNIAVMIFSEVFKLSPAMTGAVTALISGTIVKLWNEREILMNFLYGATIAKIDPKKKL